LKAFQLHVLEGKSAIATAQELQMTRAAVYQAKSRICRRLKERLDEMDPEGDL